LSFLFLHTEIQLAVHFPSHEIFFGKTEAMLLGLFVFVHDFIFQQSKFFVMVEFHKLISKHHYISLYLLELTFDANIASKQLQTFLFCLLLFLFHLFEIDTRLFFQLARYSKKVFGAIRRLRVERRMRRDLRGEEAIVVALFELL